jgi:hypothetical protein
MLQIIFWYIFGFTFMEFNISDLYLYVLSETFVNHCKVTLAMTYKLTKILFRKYFIHQFKTYCSQRTPWSRGWRSDFMFHYFITLLDFIWSVKRWYLWQLYLCFMYSYNEDKIFTLSLNACIFLFCFSIYFIIKVWNIVLIKGCTNINTTVCILFYIALMINVACLGEIFRKISPTVLFETIHQMVMPKADWELSGFPKLIIIPIG